MSSPPVRLTIDWVVPLGEIGPITSALHALTVQTRTERGCVECGVATRLGAHTTIHFTEDWATEADLRAHVLSGRFTQLAELVESASAPPRIEFQLPDGIRGLDYAVEVRRNLKRGPVVL
jgi:quinol monooxygenase YgiN